MFGKLVRSLAVVAALSLVGAGCGSGNTTTTPSIDVAPADPSDPFGNSKSETTLPKEVAETDVSGKPGGVQQESSAGSGKSADELRTMLAEFQKPEADLFAEANKFTTFPATNIPDGQTFSFFKTEIVEDGRGKGTLRSSLKFTVPLTQAETLAFYKKEISDKGWTLKEDSGEDYGSFTTLRVELPESGGESFSRARMSITVFSDDNGPVAVKLDFDNSRKALEELGDISIWSSWAPAEIPLPSGGLYIGGGAETVSGAEKSFLDKPGDTLIAEYQYNGKDTLQLKDDLRELGEAAGYTAADENGNLVLKNDTVEISYNFGYDGDSFKATLEPLDES